MIEEDLPWDRAVEASMPAFLSQYTLHDSNRIMLRLRPNLEGEALIRWDTFRSDGRVAYPGSAVADWPVLLIEYERVCQARTSYQQEESFRLDKIMGYAVSEPVIAEQRGQMLDRALEILASPHALERSLLDQALYRTVFSPVYEAWVELWHGGTTRSPCTDREMPIPDPGT